MSVMTLIRAKTNRGTTLIVKHIAGSESLSSPWPKSSAVII